MNYRRILMGGLAAGLVVNISEFILNMVVMADAMQTEMTRRGLGFTSWAIPYYVLMAFLLGLALAWLYAAMRPRFGQGPGTALIAAAAVWTLSYVLPTVSLLAVGMGPAGDYILALAWGAVELVIAASVAGYLYREAPESATQPVAAHY